MIYKLKEEMETLILERLTNLDEIYTSYNPPRTHEATTAMEKLNDLLLYLPSRDVILRQCFPEGAYPPLFSETASPELKNLYISYYPSIASRIKWRVNDPIETIRLRSENRYLTYDEKSTSMPVMFGDYIEFIPGIKFPLVLLNGRIAVTIWDILIIIERCMNYVIDINNSFEYQDAYNFIWVYRNGHQKLLNALDANCLRIKHLYTFFNLLDIQKKDNIWYMILN